MKSFRKKARRKKWRWQFLEFFKKLDIFNKKASPKGEFFLPKSRKNGIFLYLNPIFRAR
jgi:hypothetical protein